MIKLKNPHGTATRQDLVDFLEIVLNFAHRVKVNSIYPFTDSDDHEARQNLLKKLNDPKNPRAI